MTGGERRSSEDDRHGGFMKGLQAVDAIERDEHEFVQPRRKIIGYARTAPPGMHPDDHPATPLLPAPAETTALAPEDTPEHSPLDDIDNLLRALTYGEMIELAEEMWKARGDGEITLETLPAVLHRWSTTRRNEDVR
jgi:hypothetical protein